MAARPQSDSSPRVPRTKDSRHRASSAIPRIAVIAANVFREVIRDRVLYIIIFYAVALGLASRLLPEVSANTDRKILVDFGLAAMQILGLVLTIFIGTGLVNREIEKRTVLVLIAKPVSRSEFVIGKHLGLSAVLFVLVAAMTAIFCLVMQVSKVPYPLPEVWLSGLFLWEQLALVAAVAIGFGVFTSSLLATLMTFAVVVMGSLSADILKLGKLTQNPAIERVTSGLYLVLPDLSRLDFKNQAVYHLMPSAMAMLQNAGYGLLYMVLVLAIASLIFAWREF